MIVYIPYCITSWHIWYEVTQKMLKDAVCNWLLKGENILTSHTCFSERTILMVSYSTLECVFGFRMPIFVLDCVILPTTILPNSILTPWVASWWKTQWSQILPNLKNLGIHLKSHMTRTIKKWLYQLPAIFHCQLCSFLLLVLNLATHAWKREEKALFNILDLNHSTNFNR